MTFPGTMNPSFRQIGNAVPPVLAREITRTIVASLRGCVPALAAGMSAHEVVCGDAGARAANDLVIKVRGRDVGIGVDDIQRGQVRLVGDCLLGDLQRETGKLVLQGEPRVEFQLREVRLGVLSSIWVWLCWIANSISCFRDKDFR